MYGEKLRTAKIAAQCAFCPHSFCVLGKSHTADIAGRVPTNSDLATFARMEAAAIVAEWASPFTTVSAETESSGIRFPSIKT